LLFIDVSVVQNKLSDLFRQFCETDSAILLVFFASFAQQFQWIRSTIPLISFDNSIGFVERFH